MAITSGVLTLAIFSAHIIFPLFDFIPATIEATLTEINANNIQSVLTNTIHSYHQIKTLTLPLTYSLFLLILFIPVVGTITIIYPNTPHEYHQLVPSSIIKFVFNIFAPLIFGIHSYLQFTYSLFLLILYISVVGIITYITYHRFYRIPIKFIFYTFVALAAALLFSETIVILIALASVLFVGLVSRRIELFVAGGVLYESTNIDNIHSNSDYFTGLVCGVFLMILLAVVLYVQVNLSLASVIFVVVESSKWGLESLRRSKDLVRGTGLFFSLLYICGSISIIIIGGGVMSMGRFSYGWKSWVFMVQTMVGPIFVPIFMRFYMMAFWVLYVYEKAPHLVDFAQA